MLTSLRPIRCEYLVQFRLYGFTQSYGIRRRRVLLLLRTLQFKHDHGALASGQLRVECGAAVRGAGAGAGGPPRLQPALPGRRRHLHVRGGGGGTRRRNKPRGVASVGVRGLASVGVRGLAGRTSGAAALPHALPVGGGRRGEMVRGEREPHSAGRGIHGGPLHADAILPHLLQQVRAAGGAAGGLLPRARLRRAPSAHLAGQVHPTFAAAAAALVRARRDTRHASCHISFSEFKLPAAGY